jgi:hypothetical protein
METESKPRVEQVEAVESTETESKTDATKIFSAFLSFENNGSEKAEPLLNNNIEYDLSTNKSNVSNLPAKIEGKSDGQNSSNDSKLPNSESPELDAFASIVQEIDSEIHDQPQSFAAPLSPAVDHPVEDITLNYSSEILNETYESTEEIEEIPLGRVPSDDRTAGADEKGIVKRRKKKVKKHQTDEKSAPHKKEPPANQSNTNNNTAPVRQKTAGNNTRKSLTAEELAALPLTLYHSELVENKYDRPVIVSMLVPERYIHHTNNKSPEGSNPPSPKSSSHLKRQTTMDSQYQHEVSMEDFAQVDGQHPPHHPPPRSLETDREEDNFSNHSNVEHTSSERPHSPSALYEKLTPNKHMKYFVIKVNDLVSSREASYTVLLRDFGSLLHDLIKEYQTTDVTEFFQPFLLSWWKENLKKIVLIYDKPNGMLSLVIDKKLIKKIMRKKMEHYYWMKENLSNSYRQYEEKHNLPALEKMTMSASMSYDESYHGEASHYEIRNEHCEDVPIDPNGESSQEDLVKMRKGVPVRKAVEFSAENVSNDSTSEKKKNTGTILKQSQSRSERILPTTNPENGELSTEELNNMSFDFQDHPPPTDEQDEPEEKAATPSQQPKLNQTRNSGVSKSMPNFGSRSSDNLAHHSAAPGKSSKKNKSHEQQQTAGLQTPDDDKNLPVEEEEKPNNNPKPKKEKRASMKNYNRPTNPKTNELLMVAYGRPQDYQPDASSELLALLDEEPKSFSAGGGKQKIRSSITRSSVTRSSTAIKTVNGEQQQDKSTVKASKKASLTTNEMPVKGEKEEKKKPKKNKRLSVEATEDTSVGIDTSEFVLSPYDAKTKRVSSPKQSSKSPDIRNSTKLPAITTNNTHGSQTTGQRSHSPKNIFRISNPYSFALQQSYENGPQTHSEPFHSTGELPTINHHSVVSSPDLHNHSRPLSPLSPVAAVAAADIAAKLYYDTNYNPDDHHSLLDHSSLLDGTEDSFSNSQVSSFEVNPQQQSHSNNVPFQKQNSHHSQQQHQHPHSSSFLFNRANTPFESEIHGLRGSAKLAADIIKKARKTVSSDIKFQVRKVSQTEQKLLQRYLSYIFC